MNLLLWIVWLAMPVSSAFLHSLSNLILFLCCLSIFALIEKTDLLLYSST